MSMLGGGSIDSLGTAKSNEPPRNLGEPKPNTLTGEYYRFSLIVTAVPCFTTALLAAADPIGGIDITNYLR